jgi:hypothetical protein
VERATALKADAVWRFRQHSVTRWVQIHDADRWIGTRGSEGESRRLWVRSEEQKVASGTMAVGAPWDHGTALSLGYKDRRGRFYATWYLQLPVDYTALPIIRRLKERMLRLLFCPLPLCCRSCPCPPFTASGPRRHDE